MTRRYVLLTGDRSPSVGRSYRRRRAWRRAVEPGTTPASAYGKRYRQFDRVAGREGPVGDVYAFDAVNSVGPDFSRLSLDCVDKEVASLGAPQGVWLDQARGCLVVEFDEKVVGAGEADLLEGSTVGPSDQRGRNDPRRVDLLSDGRRRPRLNGLLAAEPCKHIFKSIYELIHRREHG